MSPRNRDDDESGAIAMAQAMADDDMWEAYATELEHHHKPLKLSPAELEAIEGMKP